MSHPLKERYWEEYQVAQLYKRFMFLQNVPPPPEQDLLRFKFVKTANTDITIYQILI